MNSISIKVPDSFRGSKWKCALAKVLSCHRGKTLHHSQIYSDMSGVPTVRPRFHENRKNAEAKVRQQLQALRDMELIESLGKGYWRIPPGFLTP